MKPELTHDERMQRIQAVMGTVVGLMAAEHLAFVEIREIITKSFIEYALQQSNGNQSKAARYLNIHRNTMSRLVQDFDVKATQRGHSRARKPPVSIVRRNLAPKNPMPKLTASLARSVAPPDPYLMAALARELHPEVELEVTG